MGTLHATRVQAAGKRSTFALLQTAPPTNRRSSDPDNVGCLHSAKTGMCTVNQVPIALNHSRGALERSAYAANSFNAANWAKNTRDRSGPWCSRGGCRRTVNWHAEPQQCPLGWATGNCFTSRALNSWCYIAFKLGVSSGRDATYSRRDGKRRGSCAEDGEDLRADAPHPGQPRRSVSRR